MIHAHVAAVRNIKNVVEETYNIEVALMNQCYILYTGFCLKMNYLT